MESNELTELKEKLNKLRKLHDNLCSLGIYDCFTVEQMESLEQLVEEKERSKLCD